MASVKDSALKGAAGNQLWRQLWLLRVSLHFFVRSSAVAGVLHCGWHWQHSGSSRPVLCPALHQASWVQYGREAIFLNTSWASLESG